MKYFFLLLLLFSQYSRADCDQESDQCAVIGEWNFSVSIGAGVYTNPLNGGENIPLILIPEINYYGEKIFFENSTLGYTLFNGEHLVVSTIIQLNHEKAYFSRWHPQNIFVETNAPPSDVIDKDESDSAEGSIDNDNLTSTISIDDVSRKRWAVDSGIQFNWFIDKTTDIEVQILHDINNVYGGFNGQLQLNQILKFEQLPNTRMSYSLGTNINSKNLVDYFYGIAPEEAQNKSQSYQGKLSINPYFRFALVHQISTDWSAKFNVKRIFLDSNMTDSPLVKDNHINTIFAGVTYDF